MLEAQLMWRSLLFNIDRYTNIFSWNFIWLRSGLTCRRNWPEQFFTFFKFQFFFQAYSDLPRYTRKTINTVLAMKIWAVIRRPEPTSLVIPTAHSHHWLLASRTCQKLSAALFFLYVPEEGSGGLTIFQLAKAASKSNVESLSRSDTCRWVVYSRGSINSLLAQPVNMNW